MVARQLGAYLDLIQTGQGYERQIEELIAAASGMGSDSTAEMVAEFDPGMAETLEAFADVPIEAIAIQAREASDRLYRYSDEFRNKATAIIGLNLATGTVGNTARQLRQQLGITKGKAETLARTETIAAFDGAAQQRYDDAELYSQIFSAGDRRVCPFCAHRNGRVYRTRDVRLPFHPRDRCYRVPWSKRWQKDGLTDDAFVRQYATEGIALLKSDGKVPDAGLAPFEKGVLRKAPVPVWSPDKMSRLATLKAFEDKRVNSRVEHAMIVDDDGNVLLEKSDNSDSSVSFTGDEMRLMKGASVTHNHPLSTSSAKGAGFSPGDVNMFVAQKLQEIRAVSGDYVYRLRRTDSSVSIDDWDKTERLFYDLIVDDEIEKINEWGDRWQDAHPDATKEERATEKNFRVWHNIQKRAAQEFGWKYTRERRSQ